GPVRKLSPQSARRIAILAEPTARWQPGPRPGTGNLTRRRGAHRWREERPSGTLDLEADGSFTYTPDPDFNGTDSFTYTASDGALVAVATVNITVAPVNDAPVGEPDAYETTSDTPLSVPADGVLANDKDIDGDPLTAELAEPPLHGSVTLEEDGSFVYTPNLGLDGTDTFTYRVHDGETASDLVVVTLDVTFQPPATAPEGTIGLA